MPNTWSNEYVIIKDAAGGLHFEDFSDGWLEKAERISCDEAEDGFI